MINSRIIPAKRVPRIIVVGPEKVPRKSVVELARSVVNPEGKATNTNIYFSLVEGARFYPSQD